MSKATKANWDKLAWIEDETEAGPIINELHSIIEEMHHKIDYEKDFSEYLKRCYFNQVNLLEDFVEFIGEEKHEEFLNSRKKKRLITLTTPTILAIN